MRHCKKEKSGVEWAEVCFVPSAIGHSKKGPEYRYLAKREVIVEQGQLPGMEQQLSLPFPTMQLKGKKYKVYGIVTNMDWHGEELIDWYHKRCGKSEQAGTGRQLAAKANEGGSVFIDQLTSPGRKAFTPSAHPVNEESSVVRAID